MTLYYINKLINNPITQMYYTIEISTFNMLLNQNRCNFYICKLLQYNKQINSNISYIYVSNWFQEYTASRPIVPQNHNNMADNLFFISWYIYNANLHAYPELQTLDTSIQTSPTSTRSPKCFLRKSSYKEQSYKKFLSSITEIFNVNLQ